ncbi:hypothetical protein [uncultured Cellulomonas sp.]|uniref:hypothetical protein n=1 Tax=uncultured Cellulomonas sp. TaxID=189682 RepID=UPI00260AE6B0|nr:hypothetical protein [uncultured Cellulomonas sp.]
MSQDEKRPEVPAHEVLGDLTVAPLPAGGVAEAAFLMVKLDNGEWCARSVGALYNRVEFLGQLVAYTHALTRDEAAGWFDDSETAAEDGAAGS